MIMRTFLFPVINKYTMKKINLNKYPWGWMSQKNIKKIIVNASKYKYQPNSFDSNIKQKLIIKESEFEKGCKQAYKTIYLNFISKTNFVKTKYTTPELSLAINYISKQLKKRPKMIDFENMESKILTSWIEVGEANSNDHLMGKFDFNLYSQELKNSQISDCWEVYVGPLKQKVQVLYKHKNNYDVWEWEKCLMKEHDEWTVSNINDILR